MNKLKLSILLLIISSFWLQLNAQTPEIDSLENLLRKHTQEDTIRVKLLNKIGNNCYKEGFEKTLQYLQEAEELADKLSFAKGKAKSLYFKALFFHKKKPNYPKALEYYQKAINIFEEIDHKKETASSYGNIGSVYRLLGNYAKAIDSYQKSIKIKEELGDKFGAANSLYGVGITYQNMGDYTKALDCYQKSLKTFEELGIKARIPSALNGVGSIYFIIGDYDKALEYYKKALKLSEELGNKLFVSIILNNIGLIYKEQSNYDKALDYYQKSLKIKVELGDELGIAYLLNSIGVIYELINNYSKALGYFQKALKISIKIGSRRDEINCYKDLGLLYIKLQKTKQAYYYSKKAYIIANEIGDAKLLKESSEILAKSCEALGLYKEAYGYHIVFKTMSDSIFNENNIKEITKLENQYAFDKEKEAIEQEQKKKDTIQAEETKRQKIVRNSFIAGFALMFILVIVVLRNFLQKRKANLILSMQKEEIQTQAEELLTANDKLLELDTFKEEMTGMIVHDLKNPLNSIINLAKDATVIQSGKQMLNMIMNILDVHKYQESQLVVDKMDYSLLSLSQNAINEVFFLAEQKSIKIKNKITKETGVKADKEITERIFVNILTNAIKYTPNNGEITLSIDLSGFKNLTGFVKVQIRDTGQGIPQDQIHTVFEKFGQVSAKKSGKVRSTGLGLTFCKMAVEAHGGEIGVESELEKGTTFWFTLAVSDLQGLQDPGSLTVTKEKPFELTQTDKEKLKPYLAELQELEVYEHTEISKIIEQIDCSKTENLQKWKKEIEQSIYAMNEEKYKELIKLISI